MEKEKFENWRARTAPTLPENSDIAITFWERYPIRAVVSEANSYIPVSEIPDTEEIGFFVPGQGFRFTYSFDILVNGRFHDRWAFILQTADRQQEVVTPIMRNGDMLAILQPDAGPTQTWVWTGPRSATRYADPQISETNLSG